jgi:hypothetical protein
MDTIIFDTKLKPNDKLVAIILVQHMHEGLGGAEVWPSTKRIAKLIGDISPKTVERSLEHLVEHGWFEVTRRNGTVNVYRWLGKRADEVYREMIAYKEKSKLRNRRPTRTTDISEKTTDIPDATTDISDTDHRHFEQQPQTFSSSPPSTSPNN